MRASCLLYLFHLTEFVDFDDGIPRELGRHITLRKKADEKIKIMGEVIDIIKKRYENIRTDKFIENMSAFLKAVHIC